MWSKTFHMSQKITRNMGGTSQALSLDLSQIHHIRNGWSDCETKIDFCQTVPNIGHLTLCNKVIQHNKLQTEVKETSFKEKNLYMRENWLKRTSTMLDCNTTLAGHRMRISIKGTLSHKSYRDNTFKLAFIFTVCIWIPSNYFYE